MRSNQHIPTEMTLRQMDLWYRTPLGNCLLEAERVALEPYVQAQSGEHLLQIGGPGEVFLFSPQAILHSVRLSPERMPVFKGPSVRGSFEKLPFFPESMNTVLLPHVLEFVPNPQAVLAQGSLVLAPEGRLIVIGFNPWSLWGLSKCCMRYKTLPWRGYFLSALRVRQWLVQQGLTIEQTHSLFFRPPVNDLKSLQHWMALEALGRLLWADAGAVYIIVAKKQVIPLIPIQEAFRYV